MDKDDILMVSIFCETLLIWDIYLVGKVYGSYLRKSAYNPDELEGIKHWKWGAVITIFIQLFLLIHFKEVYFILCQAIL